MPCFHFKATVRRTAGLVLKIVRSSSSQQMDSFRTDLGLHALVEDGKVLEIPGGVPLLTSCYSLLHRGKTKNGVFHLMFNSCKTADVSHFKSICYIIRIIYGKSFFFSQQSCHGTPKQTFKLCLLVNIQLSNPSHSEPD